MEEQEQKLRGKEEKEQELLREKERTEREMEIERLRNLIEEKEKSLEELQKPDWNDTHKIEINRKNDESIHGKNNNDDEDDGDCNHDNNNDIDIVINSKNEKESRTDNVEHEDSRRDALEQNESQPSQESNDDVELCEVVPPKSGPTTPNQKRTSDGNFSEKILIRLEDLERTTARRTINDTESRTPTDASGRRGYSKERLQKTTDCVHNDMPTNATQVRKTTKQQRKLLRTLTELEPTKKNHKDEEWNIKKDLNDRYLKREKNKRKQRDPRIETIIGSGSVVNGEEPS